MGLLDKSSECCGANFKSNNISFVALMTLSFPMLIFAFVALIPAFVLLPLNRKSVRFARALIHANLKVMREHVVFPKLKCKLSSSLYAISPLLSGAIYKYFNLFIVILTWGLVILVLAGAHLLWH